MSGRIVHRPDPGHTCSPGWTVGGVTSGDDCLPDGVEWLQPPDISSHPPGTVVECECGKTWVSYKTPNSATMIHLRGVSFRPERWRERRRRARHNQR